MRAGRTLSTVTGMTRFWSSHTWVMPTFSPTIAFVAIALDSLSVGGGPVSVSFTPTLRTGGPAERLVQLCRAVPAGAGSLGRRLANGLSRTGAPAHGS